MTFGLPGLASNGSAAPINNIQYLHAPMQGSVSPLQMQQFNTIMSGGQGFQGGISTTGAGPTASMNNLFTQLLQSLNSGQGYSTGGGGGSTSTGTSGGWGHNHGVSSHSHGLPGGGQTFSAGQGTTHGTFGSGGMPGRLDSGVTTINNQFNSQFNLNANLNFSGAQYSHRQAPQFQAP
ncbi:MAG: hypothetical protein KDI15_11130, partial [Thiothrix sp.]|nr:hypothetical protein [Thiothrix sp.]